MEKDIAIHEGGHLIAAWHCSAVESISFVEVHNERSGLTGYVIYKTGTAMSLWCELVISLSGIAAELYVNRTTRSAPSQNDLEKAVAIAENLAVLCDAKTAFPVDTEGHKTIAQMFRQKFHPDVEHLLEAAYLKAKTIMYRAESDLYLAVGALMSKTKLTHQFLEGLLGPRPKVSVKGRFILPKRTGSPNPKTSTPWGIRALNSVLDWFQLK